MLLYKLVYAEARAKTDNDDKQNYLIDEDGWTISWISKLNMTLFSRYLVGIKFNLPEFGRITRQN